MTFIQNLDTFLQVTGPNYGHIAWWLSGVDWPTDADRNEFADLLAKTPGT